MSSQGNEKEAIEKRGDCNIIVNIMMKCKQKWSCVYNWKEIRRWSKP